MRATLLHQPGTGGNDLSTEHLLEELAKAGIPSDHHSLSDPDWCETLGGTELAIVAGGDGTVARALTGLKDRRVKLAILPLGGANNIATSLGYPEADVDRIIAALEHAHEAQIRVCEARGRWGIRRFVEAVGIGALARSTSALQDERLVGDDKRRIGREALAGVLREMAPARAAFHFDGEELPEPALLVECMNTAMIGPNLPLGPDTSAGSDALSLVWLPERSRAAMLDWLRDPEGGPPPVERRSVSRVGIDAHDEPLRIDDKTVEWDGSRITLTVLDTPVTVLVPGALR